MHIFITVIWHLFRKQSQNEKLSEIKTLFRSPKFWLLLALHSLKQIRRISDQQNIRYYEISDQRKMKNVMTTSRHPTEFSLNLILCNWISWTTHLASFSSPRGKAWHCRKCGEMQFKVHIRSFFLTQCPKTDLNKRSLHTVNQSICTHCYCFENMGRFVTCKKGPKYGLQKAGCKKQGHGYSKREEARLPLLRYNNYTQT